MPARFRALDTPMPSFLERCWNRCVRFGARWKRREDGKILVDLMIDHIKVPIPVRGCRYQRSGGGIRIDALELWGAISEYFPSGYHEGFDFCDIYQSDGRNSILAARTSSGWQCMISGTGCTLQLEDCPCIKLSRKSSPELSFVGSFVSHSDLQVGDPATRRLQRSPSAFSLCSPTLKMAAPAGQDSVPIETQHDDMIHDAQLDFYGKRLATCSSDRTIKIFDVINGEPQRQNNAGVTLKGHTGPVWQVLIWKEQQGGAAGGGAAATVNTGYGQPYGAPAGGAGNWSRVKEHSLHTASVNSVSWAPHELGAIVACASSDGKLSVLTFKNDGTWGADIFNAHNVGCNAVSWAPATLPGSLITPTPAAPGAAPTSTSVKRFASAGCDNLVKIWGFREDNQTWVEEEVLKGHVDWVRDVAWAPNIGLPRSYIATASQDRTVIIWSKANPNSPWTQTFLNPGTSAGDNKFPEVVWRVSWSLAGNILAVSCGDGKVTLWKENLKGVWECVSEMAN
ncbi:transporter protein Sec13 [Ceratobasidium sp. AG-Ba]|nr:transporter protein Sec13 [Ceratobasidium sp. AG-Ba]